MKWIWPTAGPARRGRRGRRTSPRGRSRARRGSCRPRSRARSRRVEPELLARLRPRRPARRSGAARSRGRSRDAVGRGRDVPAAAELGRDDDLALPLGLADEQAGAGDVDVDEVASVFHASIASTICRRCSASSTQCISDHGGQSASGRRCACRRRRRPRRSGTRVMKSASCSSGGPSGEPGNERLKFAPDGQSRVYACEASDRGARDDRSSCPLTSAGSVSRARRSAATWPSGSSPCTPPSTSTVGPVAAADRHDRDEADATSRLVRRARNLEPAEVLARGVEVERAVNGADPPRRAIVDNRVYSRQSSDRGDRRRAALKITDVEAIVLRQPVLDDGIADGSQDDLVILVHTDEGITGIGEVDSAPGGGARARRRRPARTRSRTASTTCSSARTRLDVERLWQKMYRGLIYIGRRGIALHAISGIDIALWDIKGKAAGKPVCELLGARAARQDPRLRVDADARRRRASVRERVGSAARPGLHRGQARLGAARRRTPTQRRRARRRRGRGGRRRRSTILIDAGLGYVADAEARDRRRARARADRRLLARGAVRARRVRGLRRAGRRGRHPRRRRRAGHDALGLPRADRARPRRPRPARRDALRRHHRDAANRGVCARAAASRRCRTRGRAGSSRQRRCT